VYHPDTMTPSMQSTYGLRPRLARDYIHMHANIVHHAMTQYSLNKGLRKFQKEGEKAVEKELEQLLIPQVRPAHKYPNSPWEMIHPPGGDNAVCM
jgi:hypothetical protein